jgi:hypothetical protein
VAPGAAARMAVLILANSPCASFGHLAMYLSTFEFLCFVKIALSPCRSAFPIVIDRSTG